MPNAQGIQEKQEHCRQGGKHQYCVSFLLEYSSLYILISLSWDIGYNLLLSHSSVNRAQLLPFFSGTQNKRVSYTNGTSDLVKYGCAFLA